MKATPGNISGVMDLDKSNTKNGIIFLTEFHKIDAIELDSARMVRFNQSFYLIFHIKAYDWNCPQHITAKYSIEEIQELFEPQKQYIGRLENEIKELRAMLPAT